MKPKDLVLVLFAIITTISGIAGSPPDSVYRQDTVYILQRDWHTGIVVKKQRLDSQVWRKIPEIQDARYVEVSWGDQRFYQTYYTTFWHAARAVLWPTQAVIHIREMTVPITSYYSDARKMAVVMHKANYARLCDFISTSFARDTQEIIPSTGFDYSIGFYLARRNYHLFRTCNTWVALALQKAGLAIRPLGVLNANQLFRRLKKIEGACSLQ